MLLRVRVAGCSKQEHRTQGRFSGKHPGIFSVTCNVRDMHYIMASCACEIGVQLGVLSVPLPGLRQGALGEGVLVGQGQREALRLRQSEQWGEVREHGTRPCGAFLPRPGCWVLF